MFRFSIRDVLWLTVVVGLLLAVGIEHYRTTSLRSDLARSGVRIQSYELQLVQLAKFWKEQSPEKVDIGDDRITVETKNGIHVSLNRHLKD